jgi:LPXTG-motif cell wall-anchored protein
VKHKAAAAVVVVLLLGGGFYLYRRKKSGRSDGFDRLIDPYKNYDPAAVPKEPTGCIQLLDPDTGLPLGRQYCGEDPVINLPRFGW